jgi:hypothetical protein
MIRRAALAALISIACYAGIHGKTYVDRAGFVGIKLEEAIIRPDLIYFVKELRLMMPVALREQIIDAAINDDGARRLEFEPIQRIFSHYEQVIKGKLLIRENCDSIYDFIAYQFFPFGLHPVWMTPA